MGCSGSKLDDLPLVTLCKERKEYIKTASDNRYALAAAHLTYFNSLRQIGDALCKFVDEDLVLGGGGDDDDGDEPDSPVLTLPSDEGKPGKGKNKASSSSTSISHSVEEEDDAHLHLSSDSDCDVDSDSGHIHIESSPDPEAPSSGYPMNNNHGFVYPPNDPVYSYSAPDSAGFSYAPPNSGEYGYPTQSFYPPNPTYDNFGSNSNIYYMKRSETPAQTYYYGQPESYPVQNSSLPDPYSGSGGSGGGFFGFSWGSSGGVDQNNMPASPQQQDPPPPPPSPPKSSGWDFFNVFGGYGNNDYLPERRYGYGGSVASSPDSKEVREREGIPDLEDETEQEQEVAKQFRNEKKKKKVSVNEDEDDNRDGSSGGGDFRRRNLQKNSGEGTSRGMPKQSSSEGSSGRGHLPSSESSLHSIHEKEIKSSPDTDLSKNSEEENVKKKRVSFEFEEPSSAVDIGSSKGSSLTTLSVHGTRDIQEVVKEIRDEFETASGYGKEVALLLEVGRLPYQSRVAALKVILSRILHLVAPSMLSAHPPSKPSIRLSSKTMKMAKAYQAESGHNQKFGNLSATLEKLNAWEKKLYKEVKDEEKLRIVYEKQCKRLKRLDDHGAEAAKIDSTQASVRKLLTKINVCIRAVETISRRIHKLRDEELLPQVTELIHGLIRMWKSMLKCHQKQLQAIMESKIRSLKVNANLRKDSTLQATIELEMKLMRWCTSFNNWVNTQKSYVESLNGWLLRCINSEPEETPDGVAPFSPSRMGAPPIFVICNDWCQAMERISQQAVADAMYSFASTLQQLWERQDEAQHQRMKAEKLSRDLQNQLKKMEKERVKRPHGHGHEASSDKSSKTPESELSALDDLPVDLDSMRKRISEEKARHKEAVKLVNSTASNSLQTGLIPIFEALGSFTSETLKVHEQVRLFGMLEARLET